MWTYTSAANDWASDVRRPLPDGRTLSSVEIESEARRLRAQAVARWVHAALAKLVAPLLAWHRRRRVTNELMALDERTLADIGITRADIPAIAAGAWLPEHMSRRGEQPAFAFTLKPGTPANDTSPRKAA